MALVELHVLLNSTSTPGAMKQADTELLQNVIPLSLVEKSVYSSGYLERNYVTTQTERISKSPFQSTVS